MPKPTKYAIGDRVEYIQWGDTLWDGKIVQIRRNWFGGWRYLIVSGLLRHVAWVKESDIISREHE